MKVCHRHTKEIIWDILKITHNGFIPMSLTNSYIAVGSDLWNDRENTNNVHPYCKYEQAERVSALIDAVVYGGQTVDKASGPIVKSYEIAEDGKTIVVFENGNWAF